MATTATQLTAVIRAVAPLAVSLGEETDPA